MRATNLEPRPEWFHDRQVRSLRIGMIQYFSASHLAEQLGIPAVGEAESAAFFILYQPFVLGDRRWRDDDTGEVFMPLPVIYTWLLQRETAGMTEKDRKWLGHVMDQVNEILNSSPEMARMTRELFGGIESGSH